MKILAILAGCIVLLAMLFKPWDPDGVLKRPKKPPPRPDGDAMPQALIDLLCIEATFNVEVCGVDTELHVVRFDCSARDEDILEALSAHALRVGTREELHVLAESHSSDLSAPLVALGSGDESDDGEDDFTSLDDPDNGVTGIAQRDRAGRWPGFCRFLAANRPNDS